MLWGKKTQQWRKFGVAAVFLTTIQHGHAALVENLTLGNAKALALANAVTADPPGIDSIHFNPAGLAAMKGRQSNLKILAAAFQFKVDFGDYDEQTQAVVDEYGYEDEAVNNTSETTTIGLRIPFKKGVTEWPLPFLIAPLGGASYSPPNSNITFATSVYAPMAAGYIRDEDDPGRFMGESLSLAKITYFSPSFGLQLTEEWAVGASLGMSWTAASATTDLRVPNFALVLVDQLMLQLRDQNVCPNPNDPDPFLNLCGTNPLGDRIGPFTNAARLEFDAESGFSMSVNIGALWKPTGWFTWGFVYQFENTAEMEGTYQMTYHDEWINVFSGLSSSDVWKLVNPIIPLPTGLADTPNGPGIERGKAKIDFTTPAHFATGISLQVTPSIKINIDAKWTDWKVWDGLVVKFDKQLDFTKIASLLSEYSTLTELTIPRQYESVWNWAFGLEYQYDLRLAFRAGYEPRVSSIPSDKQDVLLPLGDADLFTCGLSYQMSKTQLVELGFGYLHASADVPAGSSTNANSTDQYKNFIYNPYAGTDFKSEVNALLAELSYTTHF